MGLGWALGERGERALNLLISPLLLPHTRAPRLVFSSTRHPFHAPPLHPWYTPQVFANARSNYHCTVFHTSQPSDPRPNPTRADGGLDDPAQPPHLRRLPTPAESARELQLVRVWGGVL